MKTNNYKRLYIAVSFLVLLAVSAFSQESVQTSNNTADQMLRSSGRVNPSTLGMEFDLPLGSYPGRGINLPLGLNYSSKQWRLEEIRNVVGGTPANQSWVKPLYSADAAAGWSSSLSQPYIEYTGYKYRFSANGSPQSLDEVVQPGGSGSSGNLFIKRITIFLPSGSVELRAQDAAISLAPDVFPTGTDWDGTFYSTDGSGMKYVQNSAASPAVYRLYTPDGSYYDFDTDWKDKDTNSSTYDWMKVRFANKLSDVHGNYVQYHEPEGEEEEDEYPNGYWTDQLGRTFPVMIPRHTPTMPSGETVLTQSFTMPGMTQPYTFKWKKLKNTTAATSAFTDFINYDLHYLGPFAGASTSMPYSPSLFSYETTYRCAGGSQLVRASSLTSDMFNPVVLTDIILPTGAAYTFSYSEYGEVERINYPTGGREEIDYAEVPGLAELTGLYKKANRGVVERRIYESDSDSTADTWEFSAAKSDNNFRTSVVAPDGTQTDRFMHRGAPPPPCVSQSSNTYYGTQWGYDNIFAGMVYEERVFSSDSTPHILTRKLTKWTATTSSVVMTNPSTYMQRNARIFSTENITYDGDTGLSAATKMIYDSDVDDFGSPQNSIRTQEYAFSVVSGGNSFTAGEAPPSSAVTVSDPTTSATLVRISETDYLNTTSESSLATTKANAASKNVVRLPISTRVKTPSGTIVSQSIIYYDTTGKGLPLTTYIWDSTKGAVTNSGSYISTSATYDSYGNRLTSTDAKGYTTTTSYDSTYNAYPVSVTSPVPDSSGTYGSSTALVTQTSYNTTTGLVLTTTNANGQVAEMVYDSGTLRLTSIEAPNGHITEYEYGVPDSSGKFSSSQRFTKTRTQIDESNWNEEYKWTDGLGRAIKGQKVDPAGDIFVETEFDNMGRIKKVSNPYRTGDTLSKTETIYDDLGRKIGIKTPDNAQTETTFGIAVSGSQIGKMVTGEDQSGKVSRSITDVQDRLLRIDEPNSSNQLGSVSSPNQSTTYTYDVLGNVLTIAQGGQTRSFTYSSLSKMTEASNPESGVIKYTYDANGHVQTTRNDRGIKVIFDYDRLNRPVKRCYRVIGSGSLGATSCADAGSETVEPNTPDVSYYYDNITNAKGALVKVSSSVSTTEYTSFDNMGRITGHKQTIGGTDYTTAYAYNLSGALIEETYPSTRKTKTVLDAGGDLSMVQSKKNSSAGYWNYAQNYTYTTAGEIASVQLGNFHWENAVYNSRRQVTEIGLGTIPSTTNLLKLVYSYGTTQNNGNILSQTITVPAVGSTSGFVATQTYNYDSLNRLTDATETVLTNQVRWKQSYLYDRYGNRTLDETNTTTLTKNCSGLTVCASDRKVENPSISTSTNRIVQDQDSDSVNDYVFDAAGNTTRAATGSTFVYDGDNRQVQVKDASNNVIAQYFYDGDRRRVKKIIGSEVTIFIYNAQGRLIAEYTQNVTPESNPSTRYLTNDNLGSTRIITGSFGQVLARRDYMPFGEEITEGRSEILGYKVDSTTQNFTSKERDPETGFDYFLARYYSNHHGRFTSPDPVFLTTDRQWNPQMLNLYSYAINNPLVVSDPTGMIPVRLGREMGQINSDIAAIDEQLKQEGLTDEQKRELRQRRRDLIAERDANKVIGAWLAALKSRGLLARMKLSDFTILTDPVADYTKMVAEVEGWDIAKAQAMVATKIQQGLTATTIKGRMYIVGINPGLGMRLDPYYVSRALLTDPMASGGGNYTSSDMILFGATFLRHEKVHKNGTQSEVKAFERQLKTLDKIGPEAFSKKEVFESFKQIITTSLAEARSDQGKK